jgi:hypothetical protein
METSEETKPKSSSMFACEPQYDRATQTLTLTFAKGGAYTFPNFDPENAAEFIAADSWGKWYHAHKGLFTNGVNRLSSGQTAS